MPGESRAQSAVQYLTEREAADFLRLSPRTLEKHRNVGTGPRFRKFGRIVRYTLPDLKRWAESRNFGMTSDPDYPALPMIPFHKGR